MNLNNKTALVTGGGSGIGLAIANQLVANGMTVIICGRNESKLEKAKSNHPKLLTEVCDVTNSDAIAELVKTLEKKHNGIDLLVNNAGVFENIDYTDPNPSMEIQEREIAIDFTGPIRMVNHFLPMLKQRNEAAIANVSSGLAYVPLTVAPVYSATKAGLHAWTRSFRFQMARTSVKVFELLPPLVDTEMTSQFKGVKMMQPDAVAKEFVKGLQANKYEITPGQSSQLKMMSRLAPSFIFKAVNKQFS